MEEIGAEVPVELEEIVSVIKNATQFNILQAVIKPASHELHVEVCLFDVNGKVVGKARWIQLNPLEEDGEVIDNWAQIITMPLTELNARAKERLKEMTFGG